MPNYFKRIIFKLPQARSPQIVQYYLKKILSLIFIYFCISATHVPAKEINTIAILDLSSTNIDEKYAKIIRNELEYNLYQAKDFRVLEREKIDIVIKENKIKASDPNKQNVLISIGKTLSADYILAGEIQKAEKENKLLVKLRVINVVDGTVLYFYPKKIDDISEIKNFTKSISFTIISDLIYYNIYGKTRNEVKTAESPLIQEKKISDERKFNLSIFPEYIFPLGGFGNIVKMGYGIGLYGGTNDFFIKNFYAGIETGIIKLDHKDNKSDYFLEIPFLLNIKYSYIIFNFFYIAPEFKAGPAYFSYHSKKNKDTKDFEKNAIEIMSQIGIAAGKKISDKINISISLDYGIIFEKEDRLSFVMMNIGIGYTF